MARATRDDEGRSIGQTRYKLADALNSYGDNGGGLYRVWPENIEREFKGRGLDPHNPVRWRAIGERIDGGPDYAPRPVRFFSHHSMGECLKYGFELFYVPGRSNVLQVVPNLRYETPPFDRIKNLTDAEKAELEKDYQSRLKHLQGIQADGLDNWSRQMIGEPEEHIKLFARWCAEWYAGEYIPGEYWPLDYAVWKDKYFLLRGNLWQPKTA